MFENREDYDFVMDKAAEAKAQRQRSLEMGQHN
jgi:hypothetical protein